MLPSNESIVVEKQQSIFRLRYLNAVYNIANAGDRFPLDGGKVSKTEVIAFETGRSYTLSCPAAFRITSDSTLIWSFGAPDTPTTTVLGRLDLPEGSKTMRDFDDSDSFDISSEGSLVLTNYYSQDGDVRFWCHVFPEGDEVIRSYVDVVITHGKIQR